MQTYRYTVGLRSILLAIAGEGESERSLLTHKRERVRDGKKKEYTSLR